MSRELERIASEKNSEERLKTIQRVAIEAVEARLKDGLSAWRGNALEAAQPVNADLEAGVLKLINEVRDQQATSSLVFVLGEVGGAKSIPAIMDFLIKTTDEDKRLASIDALGKIGGKEAIQILRQCAETDPSELVRGFALQALVHLHHNAVTHRPLTSIRLGGTSATTAEFVERVAQKDVSLYVREMAKG